MLIKIEKLGPEGDAVLFLDIMGLELGGKGDVIVGHWTCGLRKIVLFENDLHRNDWSIEFKEKIWKSAYFIAKEHSEIEESQECSVLGKQACQECLVQ